MQQNANDFTMLSWEEMRKRAEKRKKECITSKKTELETCMKELDKIYPEIMGVFQNKIIDALSHNKPYVSICQDDLKHIFDKIRWSETQYLPSTFLECISDAKQMALDYLDNSFLLDPFSIRVEPYSVTCFAARCRKTLKEIGMHSFVYTQEDGCSIRLPLKTQTAGGDNSAG